MRSQSHLQRLLGAVHVLLVTTGPFCNAAVWDQLSLVNPRTSLQHYKPPVKQIEQQTSSLQQGALVKALFQHQPQGRQQQTWVAWQQQQQEQQEQQQHAANSSQKLVERARHVRMLLQAPKYQPQPHSSSHAGHLSGWHLFYLMVLTMFGLAVLGFMAYKAMQWIERSRRPGYVELQSLDTAYHRPWVNL